MSLGSNNSQVNSGVWNIALNNQAPKPKVRQKKNVVYKNPQFAEAAELITDEFWQLKLYEAAKGKFPTGFLFNNGVLSHKKKKTSIQLYSEKYDLINDYIIFVRNNGNIYSPADLEINRSYTEMVSNSIVVQDTWKDISTCKSKRIIYIRDYVDYKFSHLPLNIRDDFYTLINTCYELEIISAKDIEYVNNEIVNILGITADENGVHIIRDIKIPNTKIPSKPALKPLAWRHHSNCDKIIQKILDSEYVSIYKKQKVNQSSIYNTDSNIDSNIDSDDDSNV